MTPQTSIHEQIETTLGRFNDLMWRKHESVIDEFAPDAILIGSEPGEVARGGPAIAAFFHAFFEQPVRVRWEWSELDVASAGDLAWLFAQGKAFAHGAEGEQEAAYRVSGVLRRSGDRWQWQLFHGAEPR